MDTKKIFTFLKSGMVSESIKQDALRALNPIKSTRGRKKIPKEAEPEKQVEIIEPVKEPENLGPYEHPSSTVEFLRNFRKRGRPKKSVNFTDYVKLPTTFETIMPKEPEFKLEMLNLQKESVLDDYGKSPVLLPEIRQVLKKELLDYISVFLDRLSDNPLQPTTLINEGMRRIRRYLVKITPGVYQKRGPKQMKDAHKELLTRARSVRRQERLDRFKDLYNEWVDLGLRIEDFASHFIISRYYLKNVLEGRSTPSKIFLDRMEFIIAEVKKGIELEQNS